MYSLKCVKGTRSWRLIRTALRNQSIKLLNGFPFRVPPIVAIRSIKQIWEHQPTKLLGQFVLSAKQLPTYFQSKMLFLENVIKKVSSLADFVNLYIYLQVLSFPISASTPFDGGLVPKAIWIGQHFGIWTLSDDDYVNPLE